MEHIVVLGSNERLPDPCSPKVTARAGRENAESMHARIADVAGFMSREVLLRFEHILSIPAF